MKDLQTKGTGNSRFLKTSLAEGITWEQALAMLRAGTFPVDFNGFNQEGIETLGTLMKKSNILTDELATALGLTQDDPTILDVFTKLKKLVATAQSTANSAKTTANAALPKSGGTMTGNLILKGDPTSNLMAATKQYVDNSGTPAELLVTTNAGVTVKASLSRKTVSATADSSGLAILKIPGFGTWTVSATINGVSISIDYEIKAIAQYELALSTDLETAGWDVIDSISKSGNAASIWSVGDKKTINIDGTDYQFQIIGFNHDTKTAGGTAGITFQMVDCMNATAQMNSSNTNSGGWTSCAMRTSVLNSIFSRLPADLQKAIKAVNKLTSAGNQSATINTTSDKLFLLSEVEIFGSTTYSKSGEGSQYAYYKAGNSKVKKVNGSASDWWERSPCGSGSTIFCLVDSSGDASADHAGRSYGVAFGFCI